MVICSTVTPFFWVIYVSEFYELIEKINVTKYRTNFEKLVSYETNLKIVSYKTNLKIVSSKKISNYNFPFFIKNPPN